MEIEKLKGIEMSLMLSQSDVDVSTGKADYIKKGTAKFEITPKFFEALKEEEEEDLLSGLVKAMYEELLQKIFGVDTIGMKIEYDGITIDNAIKMDSLNDMQQFGMENMVPIYEFFKMTLKINGIEE